MQTLLQTTLNGLLTGGLYALVGIGLAIIFGVMRIINFAHGEIMMIGMYLTFYLFTLLHVDPYLSMLVNMAALFLLGVLIYRFLISRVMKAAEMNQILLTAGLGLMLTNLAQLLFTANYKQIRTAYSDRLLHLGGFTFNLAYVVSFVLALLVTGLLYQFVMRSEFGRSMRAVAQNREAAELMGINVSRVSAITFGLGTAAAGAAAALLVPVYYFFPGVGGPFTEKSFVIVVLGGMGSIVGATFGGLILGVAEALTSLSFGEAYKDIAGFVIFLAILLLRPSGLFGRSRA